MPYYGFQIPGFRSLLQTFTAWIQCPTRKNFPNSESGIPYILHGAITHCVSFFSYYFHLFAHLIQSKFVLCSITRYTYYCSEVVICIVFVCINGASARFSQRRPIPIENGNLSMPENLVMTSAYARCLSIQTLRVGVKKLSRVEKEVSDICVAVPFDEKLTILRTTNGVACVRLIIGLLSEINFLGFTFCLVTLLVTFQENPSLARRNKKYN